MSSTTNVFCSEVVMKNKIECPKIRERFLDLNTKERGLASDPIAASHVAECQECNRVWSALAETYTLLDEWRAPEAASFWTTRFQVRLDELRTDEAIAANSIFGRIRAFLIGNRFLGLPVWQPAMVGALAIAMTIGISLYQQPILDPITPSAQTNASGVHDLNKLEQNQDIYASMDVLDDLPNNNSTPPPSANPTDDAQKDTSRM